MAKKECVTWKVTENEEVKLKLTTSAITELESKFKCNLVGVLQNGTLPPLNVMLTIVHAAAQKYDPKVKYRDIVENFDKYVDEGNGSQTDFLSDVILPLLGVSGFFSQAQAESMEEILEEAKEQTI